MNDFIDILIARLAIWSIKRGYGDGCETKDIDDFPELKNSPEARCGSCKAKEVVDFLEHHIKLIKE